MKRCNHIPAEIFPRRSHLPSDATQKNHIDLFLKMLGKPTDWVICQKCRKIGHYIKSRRGGIRWHTGDEKSSFVKETLACAAECWNLVGIDGPAAIYFHKMHDPLNFD